MSLRDLLLLPLLALLLAPATGAVIHDLCDGDLNDGPPPDDPGFAHVGTNTGPTVIYMGNGWILTASHVAMQTVRFGTETYEPVGPWIQILNPSSPHADLAVWQIEPHPNLPVLPIRSAPLFPGDEVVMIGRGRNRGAATQWMGNDGYLWGPTNEIRWGTNRIDWLGDATTIFGVTQSIRTRLDAPPAPLGTPPCPPPSPADPRCDAGVSCPEAQATVGDSGGAVFAKNGSDWELAGVIHATGESAGQPAAALYGNFTYAADLTHPFYRDQIIALIRPECSDEVDNDSDGLVDFGSDPGCLSPEDDHESPDCDGADTDLDGIGDLCDNCLEIANASQLDADGDTCGNACDGDFDQDTVASGNDFFVALACSGQAVPGTGPAEDPTCAESDMDGDGAVAGSDVLMFFGELGTTAGPSLDPHRNTATCP